MKNRALVLSCAFALAAAGLAAAQPPVGPTEFVAIGGARNFIAFGSPQLVAREPGRVTASLIYVVDPPPRDGTATAAETQWIDCAAGTIQPKARLAHNAKGEEVRREEVTQPAARPVPGSLGETWLNWVCTGKQQDAQAARYPTLEAAIAGGQAILARNRAAAAAK